MWWSLLLSRVLQTLPAALLDDGARSEPSSVYVVQTKADASDSISACYMVRLGFRLLKACAALQRTVCMLANSCLCPPLHCNLPCVSI